MKGIAGFFLVVLINIILIIIIFNFAFSIPAILYIGLLQLVIIAPLVILNWKNNKQLAQGMIIGASMVFMISSLCWGLMRGL
jgi:hypothetical protein